MSPLRKLFLAPALLCVAACYEAGGEPSIDTSRRGPYLQAPGPSEVMVSWTTDEPSSSRVSYGLVDGNKKKATGIVFQQQLISDDELIAGVPPEGYQHQVLLGGLESNQRPRSLRGRRLPPRRDAGWGRPRDSASTEELWAAFLEAVLQSLWQ